MRTSKLLVCNALCLGGKWGGRKCCGTFHMEKGGPLWWRSENFEVASYPSHGWSGKQDHNLAERRNRQLASGFSHLLSSMAMSLCTSPTTTYRLWWINFLQCLRSVDGRSLFSPSVLTFFGVFCSLFQYEARHIHLSVVLDGFSLFVCQDADSLFVILRISYFVVVNVELHEIGLRSTYISLRTIWFARSSSVWFRATCDLLNFEGGGLVLGREQERMSFFCRLASMLSLFWNRCSYPTGFRILQAALHRHVDFIGSLNTGDCTRRVTSFHALGVMYYISTKQESLP